MSEEGTLETVSARLVRDGRDAEPIELDALTQPETIAALAYWRGKLKGRLMPHPRDLNPAEIPRLLPNLTIIEVLPGPPIDCYYRIEGEASREALGFGRMGRRLSELKDHLGPVYPGIVAWYEGICAARVPVAYSAGLSNYGRGFYRLESLSVPFSEDGETVKRIMTCIGFLRRPDDVAVPVEALLSRSR